MKYASFDSNIAIDLLSGHGPASREAAAFTDIWTSRISWIEVLAGIGPISASFVEDWPLRFIVDELDERISRRAMELRRGRGRLKLPDAIILASAEVNGRTLVTRNARDFPADQPGVRVPYTI